MRYNEFKNEANELRFVKLVFEKTLKALKARYLKRLKLYKNQQRIAKQRIKNRKIRSNMNTSTIGVNSPDRPKR